MEPDRFDDVELQVFEQPAPSEPRRGARWLLAFVAAALTAGALAAGASALTGSAAETTPPASEQQLQKVRSDAVWYLAPPCSGHSTAARSSAPLD